MNRLLFINKKYYYIINIIYKIKQILHGLFVFLSYLYFIIFQIYIFTIKNFFFLERILACVCIIIKFINNCK